MTAPKIMHCMASSDVFFFFIIIILGNKKTVKNEENSMVLLSLKYLVPRTLGKLNFIIHIMNLN